MARNKIKFVIVGGGLGTPLATDDHITLLIGSHTAAPAAFGTNLMKSFRSIGQVEAAGITSDAANYKLDHFTASEYFRVHSEGELYIGYKDGDFTAAEINTGAAGKIKFIGQIGEVADKTKLNTLAANLKALNAPVYGCLLGLQTVADIDAVTDLGTENFPYVSVLIAGDGGEVATALATALTITYIPAVGSVLGVRSLASVHESVMWREKFNVSDGENMETTILADGSVSGSDAVLLDALYDKRYLFFEKEAGLSGTYLNDSHTAIAATSDFAYIERNAVIGKSLRLVDAALVADKGRPLYVESDGTLSPSTIAYFKGKVSSALGTMQGDGEISDYEVTIDDPQNVLSTSNLEISLKILPVGAARNIEVTMSFATKLG